MADIAVDDRMYTVLRQPRDEGNGRVAGRAETVVRSVAGALSVARSQRRRKPMSSLRMGLSGAGMPEAFIAW